MIAAYVKTDENGRIEASTTVPEYAIGMVTFNFDDDFDFMNQYDYVITDGVLEYSPLPAELSDADHRTSPTIDSQLRIAATLYVQSANLDDDTALSVSELYPLWEANVEYKVNDIRRYDDGLYRALSEHTSESGRTPDTEIYLWRKIEYSN